MSRLFVVGLGLIGGSIAKGAKQGGLYSQVVGFDQCRASCELAITSGVVDVTVASVQALCEQFGSGDLLVVAVPSLAYESTFESLKACAFAGGVITDAASVKGAVVKAAESVWGALPQCYVPGHPIAGSERSGVQAANDRLYQGRRVIITPNDQTNTKAVDAVTRLWQGLGADVLTMSVADHDRVLAATSHLPHAIAYSLVDTLANDSDNEHIFRYAAGGFKDFTRIASSDPTMWHDIMIANQAAVLEAIDLFSGNLQRLRSAVEHADSDQIFNIFTRAREAREQFLQIEQQRTADQEVK